MTEEESTDSGLKIVHSISGVGRIGQITCTKVKLDHLLTPHTKNKFKWIKDLNVRLKIIKVLEENTGSKISDIPLSDIFSDISPQTRETKEKQMVLHQTKKVLHSKGYHQQNKKTPQQMGEHIRQYI